jgi:hydrogenase/urease accessory protein HupE
VVHLIWMLLGLSLAAGPRRAEPGGWRGAEFAPLAHPDSRSRSTLSVEGSRVGVELRCQARSLIEAFAQPPIDTDGDRRLDESELDLARGAIGGYLLAHYELFPSAAAEVKRDVPLPGRLTALAATLEEDSALEQQWILAHLEFEGSAPLVDLAVRVALFREQNPFHRDECRLVWNGEEPARFLFSGESGDVWRFLPAERRRPGVLRDYVGEGVRHILTGWDHIAFVCALLLASRRLRSLLGVVTAFTVAHSITLALAALELVHVPSGLVETAIALSIAYVGALNLLSKQPGSRWGEAFVFGLVHGLGFAGFLGDLLADEPLRLTALLGFNLGVECGQLAIVLPLALLLRFLPGDRRARGGPAQEGASDRGWLGPRWMRVAGSAVVLVLGLYWFSERAGLFA